MRWYFIWSNSQCFRRNTERLRKVQPMWIFTFLQRCDWDVLGCGAAPLGNWLTTFWSTVLASSSKSTNLRYTDLWIRDQYCFRIVRSNEPAARNFIQEEQINRQTDIATEGIFKFCEINPLCHHYLKEIFPQSLRQYLGLIWVHVKTSWITTFNHFHWPTNALNCIKLKG